jgi:TPR repeat protein
VFPKSEEVFFALGVIATDDCAALKLDSDDTSGGARNRVEVLAQIKAKRKEAMEQKRARIRLRKGGAKAVPPPSPSSSSPPAAAAAVPIPPTEVVSGGVTITFTPRPVEAPPANLPQPTHVEEVVGEDNRLSASFFQLSAESGHAGAMVALGNLALQVAEDETTTTKDGGDGSSGDNDVTTQAPDGRGAIFPSLKASKSSSSSSSSWSLGEVSLQLALEWYERAGNKPHHHKDALFNLGQVYFEGRGGLGSGDASVSGGQRVAKGVSFFQRAASAGDSSASFFLALLAIEDYDLLIGHEDSDDGSGTSDYNDTDGKEALRRRGGARGAVALGHLEAAVEGGHGGAAYYLALLHRNGWEAKLGPPFDYSNDDNEKGRRAEGDAEEEGEIPPYRLAGFRKLLLKAANELNDPDALFCLADCCFHGTDGFEQDQKQALECWRRAANVNDPVDVKADDDEGAGDGTTNNSSSSSSNNKGGQRQQQQQPHADALCCLGAVSYHGLCGQPRDFETAFAMYQKAADATQLQGGPSLHRIGHQQKQQQEQQQQQERSGGGAVGKLAPSSSSSSSSSAGAHREAWGNLASMYALGHGVPKCMDTARHILRFLDSLEQQPSPTPSIEK